MSYRKHGKSYSKVYYVWEGIKARCLNPRCLNYKNYGARGIKLCDRWMKFENFYADMGDPPDGFSIERIDNDGDYEPNNCRWATPREQGANRRTTRLIEFRGVTKCVSDWARDLGLTDKAVWDRLYKWKWPIEKALTAPATPRNQCHPKSRFKNELST